MQELSLNVPTVVILVVIAALAVLAIRRMTRRGLCDCGDHCGDEGGCAGCSHCGSAADGAAWASPSASTSAEEVPPCCRAAQRMADGVARAVATGEGGLKPAPTEPSRRDLP